MSRRHHHHHQQQQQQQQQLLVKENISFMHAAEYLEVSLAHIGTVL